VAARRPCRCAHTSLSTRDHDPVFAACTAALVRVPPASVREQVRQSLDRAHPGGRHAPLEQLFSMEDFLATVAPSVRPFLERITTTQVRLSAAAALLPLLLLCVPPPPLPARSGVPPPPLA
jgi:hypothetical protein